MKCIYIRCGICANWTRYDSHCRYCGAFRVMCHGRMRYFNDKLIEMKRAVPMPYFETVLDRVIKRCQVIWESENVIPSNPPKAKPNWRLVKLLMVRGADRETANRLASETELKPVKHQTQSQRGFLYGK